MRLLEWVRNLRKEYVYELYLKILNKNVFYDNITRIKMLEEIIDFFKTKDNLINFLSEDELSILVNKVLNENNIKNNYTATVELKRLLILDFEGNPFDEFYELKDILNRYLINKNNYEQQKTFSYWYVGLHFVYGKLKKTEITKFINDFNGITKPTIYVNRFVNKHSTFSILNDLEEISNKLNPDLSKTYKTNKLIEIGKHYIDYDDYFYKMALNDKTIMRIFEKVNYRDLIISAGVDKGYIENVNENIDPIQKIAIENFLANLPKYLYKSENVSQSKAALIFSTIIPLVLYAALENNIDVYYDEEGIIDPRILNEILDIIDKNKNIYSEYLKDNPNLSTASKKILLSLKKSSKQMYIAIKNTKDGMIFVDKDRLLLVKGLYSSIAQMIGFTGTPLVVETTLFMLDDYIVSTGFISLLGIDVGRNVKTNLLKIYDDNKDKVLTKLKY